MIVPVRKYRIETSPVLPGVSSTILDELAVNNAENHELTSKILQTNVFVSFLVRV